VEVKVKGYVKLESYENKLMRNFDIPQGIDEYSNRMG
jgi:hypothetical protein